MGLRLEGTLSGWGRSAGAVIPALGSGRYSPGPNIVLPSWLKGSDPHFTLNIFWGQPGALATVSFSSIDVPLDPRSDVFCTLATGTPRNVSRGWKRSSPRSLFCAIFPTPRFN